MDLILERLSRLKTYETSKSFEINRILERTAVVVKLLILQINVLTDKSAKHTLVSHNVSFRETLPMHVSHNGTIFLQSQDDCKTLTDKSAKHTLVSLNVSFRETLLMHVSHNGTIYWESKDDGGTFERQSAIL